LSTPFAIGLFWISFSYTGWNAASYLAGEMKDPARTLPRATLIGTLTVTALYVALNAVFVASAPTEKLAGVLEVGQVSATALLGERAGQAFAVLIALGLVATTGAYTLTGPRVAEAMGADYPGLRWFSTRTEGRGPVRALVAQAVLAIALILTASYDTLLTAVGFVLSWWAGLTVVGVIVLRRKEPSLVRPYRALGYPLTPLVFAALTAWMIARPVVDRPIILLWAALALAGGLGLYLVVRRGSPANTP
jgi:APA family basic amino acid/polyamine antiporter